MDLFLQHKIKLNKIPRGIRQQVKLKIALYYALYLLIKYLLLKYNKYNASN